MNNETQIRNKVIKNVPIVMENKYKAWKMDINCIDGM